MAVFRRELKNAEGKDTFDKLLVFHNVKHDSIVGLFGVLPSGNYFGFRAGYRDTHILNHNVCQFEPDAFWALVAFDDVAEIEPADLPGLRLGQESEISIFDAS